MKRIPLFGADTAGKSYPVTIQRRLNCYMDIRPDEDKAKVVIYGTPGLKLFLNIDNVLLVSPSRALLASPNFLYSINANALYIFDSTGAIANQLGSLSTLTGQASMAHNGSQIVFVDGATGFYTNYDDSAAPGINHIVAAGFPNGARTVTSISGFFIVEQPNSRKFFVSAAYDASSWSALDFASAEQYPDYVNAVDTDHGMLVIFCLDHIEWWQLSGGLDFPFSPIQSATQEYGLAAIFSRSHVANTIAFLSRNPQGQVQVRWFQGYNAVVMSTPDVDAIINSFSVVDDAISLSYVTDGHEMYQITFPTANRSFLFDCTTQIWSEVQTGVGLSSRHIGNLGVQFRGKSLVSDYSNFNIYQVDSDTYTDNGETIKRLIQTRHLIEEGNVFGVDEIFLDMETGVGLQTGQGSDPQIMMQISRDGGRTFGPERWVSIGKVGQYLGPRAIWRRCGSGRDLAFRFAMTDPVKFVITYGSASLREREQ